MRFSSIFGCAIICCGLVIAQGVRAQTDESTILKDSVGKWKAEIKMWAQGPDGPPMESEGSETNEMLGDNWLVSKFQGEFGGQEFTGMGILGYDAGTKKFVNHWIDSMTPTMSNFEGTYDAASKTITMTGNEMGAEGKHTTVVKDAKTRLFTMYQKPEGATDFIKIMEITYTKQ